MPLIGVTTRTGPPEETAADTRVVGLFEGEPLADEPLQRLVELGEAKPGLKKVAVAHEDAPGGGQRRVLIAGLGKRDELDAETARVAAAAAAGRAKELGAVSLSWAAPEGEGVTAGIVEGTLLKLYSFDRFKSRNSDDNGGVEIARGDRRRRVRGRARPCRGRGRERRPRPAEPALELRHPQLPRRARRRDRGRLRVARGRAVRPRRDRGPRHGRVRRRGAGQRGRAAPDRPALPPAGRRRPAPRLRRQGRDVRHRRDLDQALGQDAGDEVRHVGWRRRARGHGGDRAARACR